MKIIFTDGGTLTCNSIEVTNSEFICDECRVVFICDVEHIEED